MILFLVGCADSDSVVAEARRCVDDHPATTRELSELSSLGDALQDCVEQEGRVCDLGGVISASAAECVADEQRFPEGLEGRRVSLHYSSEFGRLTWSIDNTLASSPSGESGGSLIVDARTGAVLGYGSWAATP